MMCRCGIDDWQTLRRALDLSQSEMGELLGVSDRQIRTFERRPHRCPRGKYRRILDRALTAPAYQARLRAANYRWPPSDLPPIPIFPGLSGACPVEGIPLAVHARCARCRILVGPGHAETELHAGYCGECDVTSQAERRRG